MEPQHFRKKPVVIEAVQLTKDDLGAITTWIDSNGGQVVYNGGIAPEVECWLVIETLEGNHRASEGDWIIKGVAGEFYPCKPDIFEATYEPASPATGGVATDLKAAADEGMGC